MLEHQWAQNRPFGLAPNPVIQLVSAMPRKQTLPVCDQPFAQLRPSVTLLRPTWELR